LCAAAPIPPLAPIRLPATHTRGEGLTAPPGDGYVSG
jgi:hypothetical protein